jgi:hypothetical protein
MEAKRVVARFRSLKEAAKPSTEAVSEIQAAIEALKRIAKGSGNPKRLLFSAVWSLGAAAEKMGQETRVSSALYHAAGIVNQTWSVQDTRDYFSKGA